MDRRSLSAAGGFLRQVWSLAGPYWRSSTDRWRARGLLAVIVTLTLGMVFLVVQLNFFQREFYNALEQRDADAFGGLLVRFCVLATLYIVCAVYKLYLTQMLQMRWRIWMTGQFLGHWLAERAYYRLELQNRGTDNPDQRIAEDLRLFTFTTLSLSLGLLSSVVTLLSFIAILWSVSGPLSFMVGETEVSIPGYMLWVALIYAVVGSILTHKVGKPLIWLHFQQERLEADLRFGLVRLRENAEGVALYNGEASEEANLTGRVERIRANWWDLMRYTKRLTSFTVGYAQVATIFPILVAAPRYFAGTLPLGGLIQVSQAFGQVEGSLSWFVNRYDDLASWKASVERLLTFRGALEQAAVEAASSAIDVEHTNGQALDATALELAVPSGQVIVSADHLRIEPGDRVVLSGPSGAGKSTLFRALAGIWPFGEGQVRLPADARMLFLPQKPYIPIGTLREAVSYPARAGAFDDAAIREALRAVRLEQLVDRLDEHQNWSMALSGGEQQRLAVARALLHKPDWLFLDEATGALDELTEDVLYQIIRERLPNATIISIAHGARALAYHSRQLRLVPDDGHMRLEAVARPRAAEPAAAP